MNLDHLRNELSRKKVIVVMGPGGVGKTTASISLAVLGASMGLKVGLLSIDPAKRLAAALGMKLGNELSEISLGADIPLKGTIHGAMLDQKAVFDEMVRKHAPGEETVDKILAHPFYQSASTKLAGPLEYMALAKLQSMYESNNFDIIILDTPPDTQALDFLRRPNILAGFMENKVMTWLVKPFYLANKLGGKKIFSVGEKLMGGIAKVTGVKALSSMAEFLVLIQDVIKGFHESGEKIVKILSDKDTAFFLIGIPSRSAARSLKNLIKEIDMLGYPVDMILLNRCVPKHILQPIFEIGREDKFSTLPLLENLIYKFKEEEKISQEIKEISQKILGYNLDVLMLDDQDIEIENGKSLYAFVMNL